MGQRSLSRIHRAGVAQVSGGPERIVLCRECGEELDPADVDVATLCDACWEDLTLESEYSDFDDVGDALSRRDDEMGM